MSLPLPDPQIYFPKGYDTNRADQILTVLRSHEFKYVDGLTQYWPPKWPTTLVSDGDSKTLTTFLAALNKIPGISVRLTFSTDLSKDTGSALKAGSWWVMYSQTEPNTLMVRINLAAESLGGPSFALTLPKDKP